MTRVCLVAIGLYITACYPPICDEVVTRICIDNETSQQRECVLKTEKNNEECLNEW